MPVLCKLYLSFRYIAKPGLADHLIWEIGDVMQHAKETENKINGGDGGIISNEEDIDDAEGAFGDELGLRSIIRSRFPAILVFLNIHTSIYDETWLRNFEAKYGLELVEEYVMEDDPVSNMKFGIPSDQARPGQE